MAWSAFYGNGPPVLVHYIGPGKRQSLARPLSHLLGGEEWVEDSCLQFLRNSRSVVVDSDFCPVIVSHGLDDNFPLDLGLVSLGFTNGMRSVYDQVHQGLPDGVPVAVDQGKIVVQFSPQYGDVAPLAAA